jgi:coproporphyrinogen III oxidase
MIDPAVLESRNARARAWFDALRDRIVSAFEQLEVDAPADLFPGEPAKFELKPWVREAGGGGVMGFLRGGRFIEKMGVHISLVHGTFTPEMAANMPGADKDPRFTATGISLIAHMRSPKVPAVHMNTRFLATQTGWFGGGADLTPTLDVQRSQEAPDALTFHAALKAACDRHDPGEGGTDPGPGRDGSRGIADHVVQPGDAVGQHAAAHQEHRRGADDRQRLHQPRRGLQHGAPGGALE